MYLIVGLGNPGKEYETTRHNAGWLAIAEFQKKNAFSSFQENKRFFSFISEGKIGKEKVILAFPQTMMNASGKAVGSLAAFYKVKPQNILIVHDDADILFGKIKLSFAKSSAGHRGVESIKKVLKTEKFWRIRIGIQPSAKKHIPAMDLVLKKFSSKDAPQLKKILKKAAEAFLLFIENGGDTAMNQIN